MDEENVQQAADSGLVDDILATPELVTPPATPDAHRAVIQSVSLERFDNEKQSVAIKIVLQSLDNASVEETYSIFLPKMFAENIAVDPNTLPEEEGNNQRFQYRIGISNTTKDATLQNLRALAYKAGRTTQGMAAPTNIEEYVEVHNALLSNLEVVFTRQPDTKAEDPRFRNRLRVNRIVGTDVVGNAKQLKKYVKRWEEAA